MPQITINGITIDPSAPHAEIAALSLAHATAHSSDYILVQTSQPLNAERYAQRESDKPLETRARPTPAFVGELPLAFRDPLASIAARPSRD